LQFIAAEEASEREDDDDINLDTPATRFTENLVEFLLKGFNAKDKTVRTRIIEMVSEVILNLGELEYVTSYCICFEFLILFLLASSSDLYDQLRAGLIDRITDKEWNVRQQAATALCKLCQNESPDEVADGEQTLSQYLIDAMKHDTQSYVSSRLKCVVF